MKRIFFNHGFNSKFAASKKKIDNSELTLSKTLRRVFHKGLLDSFVKTRVTPSQRHQHLWKTPVILSGIGYM